MKSFVNDQQSRLPSFLRRRLLINFMFVECFRIEILVASRWMFSLLVLLYKNIWYFLTIYFFKDCSICKKSILEKNLLALVKFWWLYFDISKMATLASLSSTRSFSLNVHVTDLNTQKSIEVNHESHVGFVMLEIVEKLGNIWSF